MTIGDLNFVTVHDTFEGMDGSTPTGSLTFTPSIPEVLDPTSSLEILSKQFVATLSAGAFSISLPATDDPDVSPVGWSYTVTFNLGTGSPPPAQIAVPVAYSGTGVSLALLLETTYVGPPSASYTALFVAQPAPTENTYYVSSGAKANDTNNGLSWGSPLATVAKAETLVAAAGGGKIQLGYGNFTITTLDTNSNHLTLTNAGTTVEGLGEALTTLILAGTGAHWGIVANAARCTVQKMTIEITGAVAPYWVLGTTVTSGNSAQYTHYEDILVIYEPTTTFPTVPGGTSVVGAAAFALGPDNPGSTTMDVANSTLKRCRVSNSTGTATTASGYAFGNGTQGNNVLGQTMFGCQSISMGSAITLAGCGVSWFGGAIHGSTVADINVTAGTYDPILITGVRGELGNMVLNTASGIPLPAGVTLDSNVFVSYTPTVVAGQFITHNAKGPLRLDGGTFTTTGGGSNIGVNTGAGSWTTPLIVDGTIFDQAFPFPVPAPGVLLDIRNPSYFVSGVPTLIPIATRTPAQPSLPSTSWLSPGFTFQTLNSLGIGTLRVSPVYIARAGTITAISAECTVLSTEVGAVFRVGVYADRGDGVPGALVVDGGTIAFGSGNTATQQTVTVSKAVTPGWYFVGGAVQVVTSSQPTMRSLATGTIVSALGAASLTTAAALGYQVPSISGALPNPFAASPSVASFTPRCAIQVT